MLSSSSYPVEVVQKIASNRIEIYLDVLASRLEIHVRRKRCADRYSGRLCQRNVTIRLPENIQPGKGLTLNRVVIC